MWQQCTWNGDYKNCGVNFTHKIITWHHIGWLSNMILQKLTLIHHRWVLLKWLLRKEGIAQTSKWIIAGSPKNQNLINCVGQKIIKTLYLRYESSKKAPNTSTCPVWIIYIYMTPTWFQYQSGMFKSRYLSNTCLNLPYRLRGGFCMVTKLAFHPIK